MPFTDEQKAAKGKLEFEVQVGMRMAALINDELVKKTLDGLLHGIQNDWGAEQDVAKREVLWHRFNAIVDLVSALKSHIDTGKFAVAQLESMKNAGTQE